MPYDPDRHHRRSIRLKGYDYTQEGVYYITICTHNRQCLFGEVAQGEMVLNALGQIVWDCWHETPHHFRQVELDAFVVMPNHVHMVMIVGRGTACRAPTDAAVRGIDTERRFGQPIAGSLPTIVGAFKSAVTKRINELRASPGAKVWQRGYYEHIIGSDRALDRIRAYIAANPARWALDPENLVRQGEDDFDRWLAPFGNRALE